MYKIPEWLRTGGEKGAPEGQFLIPHQYITFYYLFVQFSTGLGWEHASVTIRKKLSAKRWEMVKRTPTWQEMCVVKDTFWTDDECVVQYHPPKSQYVSFHPYCLHLWRPTDKFLPIPDFILVGPSGANNQSF